MARRGFRLTTEDKVVNTVSILVLFVVLVATLYPVYYVVIYAFNDGDDSIRGNLYLYPRVPTFDNFRAVFTEQNLVRAFLVTVARAGVGTVLSVYVMATASYALTKKNHLKFRRVYIWIGLISMYFSGGLIPLYLVLNMLQLLNTFWVLVLPSMVAFFYMLLFMAFFRQLPVSIEESAEMDGANYLAIFHRIVFPLSAPIVATISLFVAVNLWNDWFAAAFYVTKEELLTLPTILMRMMAQTMARRRLEQFLTESYSRSNLTIDSVRYAALVVTMAPIVMVYPFVQKYFVRGMMIGAIKA